MARLNENYRWLAGGLARAPGVAVPARLVKEGLVGSSLQLALTFDGCDERACEAVVRELNGRGVKTAWFGRPAWLGFTSTARHWRYASAGGGGAEAATALPQTAAMQRFLLDFPLYHTMTWTEADFELVASIIRDVVGSAARAAAAGPSARL